MIRLFFVCRSSPIKKTPSVCRKRKKKTTIHHGFTSFKVSRKSCQYVRVNGRLCLEAFFVDAAEWQSPTDDAASASSTDSASSPSEDSLTASSSAAGPGAAGAEGESGNGQAAAGGRRQQRKPPLSRRRVPLYMADQIPADDPHAASRPLTFAFFFQGTPGGGGAVPAASLRRINVVAAAARAHHPGSNAWLLTDAVGVVQAELVRPAALKAPRCQTDKTRNLKLVSNWLSAFQTVKTPN